MLADHFRQWELHHECFNEGDLELGRPPMKWTILL